MMPLTELNSGWEAGRPGRGNGRKPEREGRDGNKPSFRTNGRYLQTILEPPDHVLARFLQGCNVGVLN